MFRTLQNTVSIDFTIVPDGPILVRAQTVGIDPGVADMEFQRTHRNGRSTVFLAGSGLKGVLRSHAERLLRSADRFACDPTKTKGEGETVACGARKFPKNQKDQKDQEFVPDKDHPHAGQCPACFTFGSLRVASRFRIGDAYPAEGMEATTNRTEVRTGVGIDRKSQAAATHSGVLYDTEVVVGGGFRARVSGENFSLWQLGLVLATLQDLDSGLVRVGGCKARGMGTVRLQEWSVDLGFLGKETGALTGVRRLNGDETRDYGLVKNDVLAAPPDGEVGRRGLFRTVTYRGDAVQGLASALIDTPLRDYLGLAG